MNKLKTNSESRVNRTCCLGVEGKGKEELNGIIQIFGLKNWKDGWDTL